MMRLAPSDITDAKGRHIPVIRRRLPEDSATESAGRPAGPKNGRELARRLRSVTSKVKRLYNKPNPYVAEIARDLERLAEWAESA